MTHATLGSMVRGTTRMVNFVEYLFRRGDHSGDIYPTDASFGRVEGPDPDRIVVIGEATAMGYGVLTHHMGIAAQFARQLSIHTRRGADWSILPLTGNRLRSAPRLIGQVGSKVAGADFVILIAGIVDTLALTSTRAWTRQLTATIDAILEHLPIDGQILVAAIPPLNADGGMSPLARLATGHQARVLNQATTKVVARHPRCSLVRFPVELRHQLWRPESRPATYAIMYEAWARTMLVTAATEARPRLGHTARA
jgi:hypothetical protein